MLYTCLSLYTLNITTAMDVNVAATIRNVAGVVCCCHFMYMLCIYVCVCNITASKCHYHCDVSISPTVWNAATATLLSLYVNVMYVSVILCNVTASKCYNTATTICCCHFHCT